MDECRRYASATGTGYFSVKTEGMFLSILFAHHMTLKTPRNIAERINSGLEHLVQSLMTETTLSDNPSIDQRTNHTGRQRK